MKSWVSKMYYEDHGRFKKYKKYIIFLPKQIWNTINNIHNDQNITICK